MNPGIHSAPSSWRRELIVWGLVVVGMLAIVTLVWGPGIVLAFAIILLLGGSAVSWWFKTWRWRKRVLAEMESSDQD